MVLGKGRVGQPSTRVLARSGGVRPAFAAASPFRCDSAALTRAQSLPLEWERSAAATPSSRGARLEPLRASQRAGRNAVRERPAFGRGAGV